MPAYLPTELISLIFQFAPIVAPSKSLIQEANATFELSEAFSYSGYESFSQWFFGKTTLLDRCKDNAKRFNCLKYRCEIGEGDPCVECRYARTWDELKEDGYDGMCEQCYTRAYHPEEIQSGRGFYPRQTEPETDDEEEDADY